LPLFPTGGPPPCKTCDPVCDPTPCPPPPTDPGVISSASEKPSVATVNVEVDFHLEASAPVWATITDSTGRVVKTLAKGGVFSAGDKVLKWGLIDETTGKVVPNGTYTVNLRATNADRTTDYEPAMTFNVSR
jgi:flagellar hook assembly protein FlgD